MSDATTDSGMDAGDSGADATMDASADAAQDAAQDSAADGGPPDAEPDATGDAGMGGPTFIELPTFTTGSPTFETVVTTRLPTGPISAGGWLVLVSAILDSTATTELGAELRYLIDGVEEGYGGGQNSTPNAGGPFMHFTVSRSAGGAPIVVEARDIGGGTTTVRHLRIVVVPLSGATPVAYEQLTPSGSVTSPSFTPYLSIGYDVPRAGSYLFLGAVAANEAPSTSDIFVQWVDPEGTTQDVQNPRQTWMTVFHANVVNIPVPGLIGFALETRVDGAESQLRAARLAVIPLDHFPSSSIAEDLSDVVASSGERIAMSSLSASIPAAGAVVIQRAYVRSCGAMLVREVEFDDGRGTPVRFAHAMDNCAYEATYGTFSVAPGPGTLDVANVLTPTLGDSQTGRLSLTYILGL